MSGPDPVDVELEEGTADDAYVEGEPDILDGDYPATLHRDALVYEEEQRRTLRASTVASHAAGGPLDEADVNALAFYRKAGGHG